MQWLRSEVSGVMLVSAPVNWPDTLFSALKNTADAYSAKGEKAKVQETLLRLARMFPTGRNRGPYNFNVDDVGATFGNAMAAGLYSVKNPTPEALRLYQNLAARPDSQWMGHMTPEPFIGFVKQKLYERDMCYLFFEARRIHAIYGDEDGLFDNIQLKKIKDGLSPSHFWLIPEASHSVFIDQKEAFLRALVAIVR